MKAGRNARVPQASPSGWRCRALPYHSRLWPLIADLHSQQARRPLRAFTVPPAAWPTQTVGPAPKMLPLPPELPAVAAVVAPVAFVALILVGGILALQSKRLAVAGADAGGERRRGSHKPLDARPAPRSCAAGAGL